MLLNIIYLVLISHIIAQNYDYNTANVCDFSSQGKSQNQVAYMCTHQALGSCQLQQAVQSDGYSSFAEYGFGGYGSYPPSNYCCRCFQIQVQDSDAPAKDIIVQGINTGGDVISNQFDLSMIAGGFGANNGCANKVFAWNGGPWDGRAGPAQYPSSAAGNWCSDPTQDNSQCQNPYSGGITQKSDCAKLPNNNLTQLCEYSFDTKWRTSNGLRETIMKEVRCPAGLIRLSGCNKDDPSLPYPSGKLSASDPNIIRGKLTHMWDCCKPSCSWTGNVFQANGTAVMSCDASGTNILGTNTSFQCENLTCDPSCKTCSESNDANKCTACNTGSYLSSNPGKCTTCPPQLNCLECSNSVTCITCQTGYILQNDGSCKQPCDQSCKTCSTPQDATQCTSCNDGYYLSGSSVGTCSKCPSNCTSCLSDISCSACTDNYVLISGSCQPCNSPCLSCITDTNTCTSCIQGYTLNGNTCQATCDSTCKTCSKNQDATQCTSCYSGFYLNGSTIGSCVQCSSNCSSCTSQNSCQTCTNNTILVSGQCLSCTSPCQTCQTSVTNCLSCVQGYTLDGNTCTASNTGNCHPSCQTCSKPNDQNFCTSCPTGYLVLGGNCQPCQKPCQNCSGNPNSCTSCIANYSLSGNTCVGSNQDQTQCHPSCKTCSVQHDQNSCTSCFDGFLILGNGNCQPCQPPCFNCSGNPNSCTSCIANYSLSGNTCVGSNQDQTQCHSSCKTCSVQHDQNACTSCFDGFLILGNGNCQPCQPPCFNCSENPNSCTSCIANYSLSGNTCVGSNQDQTQCHPSCKTCSVQHDQNACTSCFDGFLILGNGNCQPCQPPCFNCSGNPNNCTACASGYAFQNGVCSRILSDSSQCNLTCQTCTQANNANACASCVSGFVLTSNNACIKQI